MEPSGRTTPHTTGHRLGTVKAEIGKLVSVVKNSGDQVFKSIKDEMTRLESEKRDLETHLGQLQKTKTPLDEVTSIVKTFIENWQGLGELLQEITSDERRTLLEQYVDVIQLSATDGDPRKGTYSMRLFPEAVPVRKARIHSNSNSQNENSDDPVLTESSPVREVSELAPPVGLEPTTRRLTAACSTT